MLVVIGRQNGIFWWVTLKIFFLARHLFSIDRDSRYSDATMSNLSHSRIRQIGWFSKEILHLFGIFRKIHFKVIGLSNNNLNKFTCSVRINSLLSGIGNEWKSLFRCSKDVFTWSDLQKLQLQKSCTLDSNFEVL